MKSGWLAAIGILGTGIFFFSAVSILTENDRGGNFSKKEVEIAMRQIGHEVLLHAGDSVSRVMPVQHIEPTVFQLEFKSPFVFVPDSLVKIVARSFSVAEIKTPFIVHVLDCQSRSVVYGFQIGLQQKTTLVPCLGRPQAEGCYVVQISFLTGRKFANQHLYFVGLAVVGLVALLLSLITYRKQQQFKKVVDVKSGTSIGMYEFFAERRILKHSNHSTELSEKETKLLKIFSSKINQPIAREQLMKEVWEDEGVIVGRSLDVFVSKLRKRLKQDPSVQLVNIHGVGYSLKIQGNL